MTPRTTGSATKRPRKKPGVFISHKLETEGPLAKFIRSKLETAAGGGLDVHISEDIPAGDPWLRGIEDQLRNSKVLLLLFTDPDADWDWCLFEAGFFWGRHRKIVCLHHPDTTAPNQLSHLQPLKATKDNLASFLRQLLTTTKHLGEQLMQTVPEDVCDTFATEVAARIGRTHTSTPLLPRIIIDVADQELQEQAIPDAAKVFPQNGALHLFGQAEEAAVGMQWADIVRFTENQPDKQWMRDLAKSVFKLQRYHPSDGPTQALYRKPSTKDAFRPQVSRVERLSGRRERFHVVFIPEPVPTLTRPITSFSDLMEQLHELIESTDGENDKIYWLAYTPALGFLARKPEEWIRLEETMRKHANHLDFLCLAPDELVEWHRLFIKRATDRGSIDETLIEAANAVSQELLKQTGCQAHVPFNLLPEYYLFSSQSRAIAVTPFFLPRLNDRRRKNDLGQLPNVEMCGVVTQDKAIVDLARKVHNTVSTRKRFNR